MARRRHEPLAGRHGQCPDRRQGDGVVAGPGQLRSSVLTARGGPASAGALASILTVVVMSSVVVVTT